MKTRSRSQRNSKMETPVDSVDSVDSVDKKADNVTFDSLLPEGRSTSFRSSSSGPRFGLNLGLGSRGPFTSNNHHHRQKADVEVVMEPEMADMTDCTDPQKVADAQMLWDRICDDKKQNVIDNECIVVNSEAFGTQGMDWGQSMDKLLPQLMCLLRNEFATVERCSDELKCFVEEYRCCADEKADCEKRRTEEMQKTRRDVCLINNYKVAISEAHCRMIALEQNARECRRKIKDARKTIRILAGSVEANGDNVGMSMDGNLNIIAETKGNVNFKEDTLKKEGEVDKGEEVPKLVNEAKEKGLMKAALKSSYLFDVFNTLLRAKLVQNERTFLQEIRRMRLQELLDEAARVKKAGSDDGEVQCEVECQCMSMMAMDSMLRRKASASTAALKGSKGPFAIPDIRCRCGARQAYERLCKKRAELKRKLQNDPASAFALDEDELLKYIRQEVFGEPKENYTLSENGNFFKWFSTYVLEVNDGGSGGETDFKPTYDGGARKKWTGLSFFSNMKAIGESLRSSKDCCSILRPRKLIAECLLNAKAKGCFVQCCAKGQQIFEKVYCDEETGSLAFICRFFTDFLLSARNVPMAGNVSGRVLCKADPFTGAVTTPFYYDTSSAKDSRKRGMKVSEMDLMETSVEISDYWKLLFNALIEETYIQIFKKHKDIKTYNKELEFNSTNRLRAVCARLVAANEKAKEDNGSGKPKGAQLLLRRGDIQIIRTLKEHRMIGGSNPSNKSDGDWDPLKNETNASDANAPFFNASNEKDTFYFQMMAADPEVKTEYEGLNIDTDDKLQAEANRKLLEMSVLRMALEGFKEVFDLKQLDEKENKTHENMVRIHKNITESKTVAANAEVQKAKFAECFNLPNQDIEDYILFFPDTADDEAKQRKERIVFNRKFDDKLEVVENDNGTGDKKDIGAEAKSFKAESGKLIADVLVKVAVRCALIWKSLRLPNATQDGNAAKLLNGNSVSVSGSSVHVDAETQEVVAQTVTETVKTSAVEHKADAKTEATASTDTEATAGADTGTGSLEGNAYYNQGFGEVSEENKFTNFGTSRSRDTYNYFSKILCNKLSTLNCDNYGLAAPLSSVDKERREHNSKLLSEMMDCLYTIHGPKQHWGLICEALEKVLISIGC